jgi:hypothetical protein
MNFPSTNFPSTKSEVDDIHTSHSIDDDKADRRFEPRDALHPPQGGLQRDGLITEPTKQNLTESSLHTGSQQQHGQQHQRNELPNADHAGRPVRGGGDDFTGRKNEELGHGVLYRVINPAGLAVRSGIPLQVSMILPVHVVK